MQNDKLRCSFVQFYKKHSANHKIYFYRSNNLFSVFNKYINTNMFDVDSENLDSLLEMIFDIYKGDINFDEITGEKIENNVVYIRIKLSMFNSYNIRPNENEDNTKTNEASLLENFKCQMARLNRLTFNVNNTQNFIINQKTYDKLCQNESNNYNIQKLSIHNTDQKKFALHVGLLPILSKDIHVSHYYHIKSIKNPFELNLTYFAPIDYVICWINNNLSDNSKFKSSLDFITKNNDIRTRLQEMSKEINFENLSKKVKKLELYIKNLDETFALLKFIDDFESFC